MPPRRQGRVVHERAPIEWLIARTLNELHRLIPDFPAELTIKLDHTRHGKSPALWVRFVSGSTSDYIVPWPRVGNEWRLGNFDVIREAAKEFEDLSVRCFESPLDGP